MSAGRACGLLALVAVGATLAAGSAAGVATARAPSWQDLPKAPIEGRLAASAVWTGSEAIVWGGIARNGRAGPRGDGAAYSPAANAWRRIADAPAGVAGDGGAGAAWTGRSLVVWAGNSPAGPAGGAVYDPRTNRWRRLPPGPLGVRDGYTSVWTGHELIVVGGASGDARATPTAAAVDPRTGAWRRLPAFDRVDMPTATGAVWTGRVAYVSGETPRSRSPVLLAFGARGGSVRRVPLAGAPRSVRDDPQLRVIGWTGTKLLFSTGADPLFASTGVVLYDPARRRWQQAAPAPCRAPAATYSQVAWAGGRLVVPCGAARLQLYDPRTDAWRILAAGPSPLNTQGWSAVVWTGRELVVWSGTVRKPSNPTPAGGASLDLGP